MPTGETEIISNPRVLENMAYIDKTYSDNLVIPTVMKSILKTMSLKHRKQPWISVPQF